MIAKKKKPRFVRQEGLQRKRLGTSWRRPRGVHSKMRRRRASKIKRPNIGYKNPEAVRGLIKEKVPVMVLNSKDIKLEKNQVAVLSGKLGSKKKLEILQAAQKAKISFLNVKDISAVILNIQTALAQRKLDRKKKLESKSKKAKKAKAKEEKKKTKEKEKAKDAAKEISKEIEKKAEELKVKEKTAEKKETHTSEAKLPRASTERGGKPKEPAKKEAKKEKPKK